MSLCITWESAYLKTGYVTDRSAKGPFKKRHRVFKRGKMVSNVVPIIGILVGAIICILPCGTLAEIPHGSLQGHLTFDEVNQWIQNTVLPDFKNITQFISIGESVEGRPLNVLCLGETCTMRDPSSVSFLSDDETTSIGQVLFTGLHHAREPLGMMAMAAFLDDLLNKYHDNDATIRHLLRRRQIVFFFVVNPDGYVANEQGNGMRRKNLGKRVEKDCALEGKLTRQESEIGVDLNRNYDFCFNADNIGASNNPCAIDYEGPHPFSEPETIAMKKFIESNHFKVAFNYHSFGREVYIPYSCKPKGVTKDETFFRKYAARLTAKNGYHFGQSWNEGLYSVNGDAADWMYETKGIFAVSPEVAPADPVPSEHDGFWIKPEHVPKLAKETLDMNYVGSWTAGSFVEILGNKLSWTDEGRMEFDLVNFGLIQTRGKVMAAVAGKGKEDGDADIKVIALQVSHLFLSAKGANTAKVVGENVDLSRSLSATATVYVWDDLDCVVYSVVKDASVALQLRVGPGDDACRKIIEDTATIAEEQQADGEDADVLPQLLVMTFFIVLGALLLLLVLAGLKMYRHRDEPSSSPRSSSTSRYRFTKVASEPDNDDEAYDRNLPEDEEGNDIEEQRGRA